jgi:enoyl-CoA hydratase/carnithine racemase
VATSAGTVEYERRGSVALITLARPDKANSLTQAMADRLWEHCRTADEDAEVRVVVLTGAGRHFSAGSDINSLDDYASAWEYRNRRDYCTAVLELRKPAIAMVNGAAFGGGLELAISCDIRLASTAARFAAPEIRLGWIGGGGASVLLPRLIGYGNAARLLLTGAPVEAHEAHTLGLVQRVVEPDELERATFELAEEIATNAPIALEAMKSSMRAALSIPVAEGMDYEEALIAICLGSEDRHEGIAAWREQRAPRFKGR